jgi:hypothetical protein
MVFVEGQQATGYKLTILLLLAAVYQAAALIPYLVVKHLSL